MDSLRRHKLFDWVFSLMLGLGVGVLALLSKNSIEFPPELWDEVAVAARLRPPQHEFPVFWQYLLSHAISYLGLHSCLNILKLLGPISLGILAMMTFGLFDGILARVFPDKQYHLPQGRLVVRLLLLQGVLFFVCSEPVWQAGRVLSPDMLGLLGTVLAILLMWRSLDKSSMFLAVLGGAISGMMMAENPLAVLPPFAFVAYQKLRNWNDAQQDATDFFNPIVFVATVRRMVWVFIFGWIAVASVNIAFYRANGGGGTADAGAFISLMRYLLNYIQVIKSAVSPIGLLLVVVAVLMPMLLVVARIRSLMDSEQLLSIPYGVFLVFAGTLALLQSVGFSDCHFWRWVPGSVHSSYLLCFFLLASSLTAMLALCAFYVDVYLRNYARLLREIFYVADAQAPVVFRVMQSLHLSVKMLRPAMRFVPVVTIALVVPFRFDSTLCEMSSIVNGIIRQSVAESAGARMLFTDGSMDSAIEVLALERGCPIKAVSMMSGPGSFDSAVRTAGVTNEEHRALLSIGAADALRTWVMEKNPCISNIALQVGLELWQHHRLAKPQAGGLVFRTDGFAKGEAEKFIKDAKALSERILRLYEDSNPIESGTPELVRMFLFGQWRLSRMCRMREDEMEHVLADRLDKANPEWQKVQERMDWIGRQDGMRLTPREGLKLGLERADFKLARSYARKIVVADADDVQANFALGMGFFTEKKYDRALVHLKRCLIRAPREPAVLNNLAIVQLRLGRFDEAETNALMALERLPDSSEIKTTLRHIRAARDELKKP